MIWKRLAQSLRRSHRQPASRRAQYRPNLDILEDRTLLSVTGGSLDLIFTVNQGSSSLALSGNIAGQDVQPQGPGSLTTTGEGQFEVLVNEASGGITFINGGAGNDVFADNSGNWQPLPGGGTGSAPANFGGMVSLFGTALAAVRNAEVGADTGGAPVTLYQNPDGSYGFPSSQNLTINAGSVDYHHPILGGGTFDLSNQSAQNQASDGAFNDYGGGQYDITIPVQLTITGTLSGFMYSLTVSGSVYGTIGFAPSPGHHGGSRIEQTLGNGMLSHVGTTTNQLVNAPTQLDTNSLGGLQNAVQTANTSTSSSQIQDSSLSSVLLNTAHQNAPLPLDQLSILDSAFQSMTS